MLFNRSPLKIGHSIELPPVDVIKNTLSLWNADIEDALKYGGELTRAAIGAMNIRGDKKNVIVDTKIHMLMPGFYPAIPGWHTDGVPRGKGLDPTAKDIPVIHAQESMDSPRFHLLVTGFGCLTEFMTRPVEIIVPDKATTRLYAIMTEQVSEMAKNDSSLAEEVPSCTAVEWDWWNVHRGKAATKHEWRFLIRVTETDYAEPQKDLRQIIRTQQNVYVPETFGW